MSTDQKFAAAMLGFGTVLVLAALYFAQPYPVNVLICVNELSGETIALKSDSSIVHEDNIWRLVRTGEVLLLEKASSDRCSAVSTKMGEQIMTDIENAKKNQGH